MTTLNDGDRPRPATIRQVATAAGVSRQTVSRYLRYQGEGLKPATLARIRAAVDDLGYRPSAVAQAMRGRRPGWFAVVLPSGVAATSLEVLRGVWDTARDADCEIEVLFVGGSHDERTTRLQEIARSGLYEGVLSLISRTAADVGGLADAAPIVLAPVYDDEMRAIGELAEATLMDALVGRLADLGHRTLVHVAGDQRHESARSRRAEYLLAVDRYGLESWGVVNGDWSGESGAQTVLDLPADRSVTALVAANDVIAAGAARGAMQRGWSVPADLSITGWDAQPLGEWLTPSLTSVALHPEVLGKRLLHELLEVARNVPVVPDPSALRTLVWRESVGPAPRAAAPTRETDASPSRPIKR